MARWGYCPSGRFFEAAACGTPIISDYFDGLNSFFDCNNELLIAQSADDVVAAINLPDTELEALARRAREHTLDEHTGARRAQELISAIESRSPAHAFQKARSEVA